MNKIIFNKTEHIYGNGISSYDDIILSFKKYGNDKILTNTPSHGYDFFTKNKIILLDKFDGIKLDDKFITENIYNIIEKFKKDYFEYKVATTGMLSFSNRDIIEGKLKWLGDIEILLYKYEDKS